MKYREVLAEWWWNHRRTLKETTIHKKENEEMKPHILPALGDMEVQDITPKVLQDFVDLKSRQGSPLRHPGGLAPNTILGFWKIIKPSLRWAVEQGYISKSPCEGGILPRDRYREVQVFSPEEIEALIDAAAPLWFGDMILLAFRTGMRRGELYGLKWSDVDLEQRFLMVRRSVGAYAPGVKLIHPPKTRRSMRRISLDKKALEMLKKRKQSAVSEWVFAGVDGDLMSPWATTKYMKDTCDAAGVPRRRFHTLRHSHASLLLCKNVHPKIVQERLGHSKISTTLDTYSHLIPTMQGMAIEVLDQI